MKTIKTMINSIRSRIFGERVEGFPLPELPKILPVRDLDCNEFNSIAENIHAQMIEVQARLDEIHEKEKQDMEEILSKYKTC